MKRGKAQSPAMQAASVQGRQGQFQAFARAVFLLLYGSGSPHWLLHLTHGIKSGRRAPGIVRVVVVGAAVGVDKAEIVRVANVDGTAPVIGSSPVKGRPATRHVFRNTPMTSYLFFLLLRRSSASLCIVPFIRSSSVSISSPRIWAMVSRRSSASFLGTLFPLASVKHPCGFFIITM